MRSLSMMCVTPGQGRNKHLNRRENSVTPDSSKSRENESDFGSESWKAVRERFVRAEVGTVQRGTSEHKDDHFDE